MTATWHPPLFDLKKKECPMSFLSVPRLHLLSNAERHCLDGVENRASNRVFNEVYGSSGMSEGKRSEMR